MHARLGGWLIIGLLAPLVIAGCVGPADSPGTGCDAWSLVHEGAAFLETRAGPEGGVGAEGAAEPDPRLTAWALLAVRLAERSGQAGLFDAHLHADWLSDRLPGMMEENTGVDSVANNLSLTRAALQAWGRSASQIPVKDPVHPQVGTLAEAWQARYDEEAGVYAERLNEHVFAGFAARVFEDNRTRLDAMARALEEEHPDAFEVDAWYAGYARALLGPRPENESLAGHLDAILEDRREASGGVRAFEESTRADASTTAAALLAWQSTGKSLEDPEVSEAVDWLCGIRSNDGAVPFAADQDVLRVKTTAEVGVALALLLEPIPWPEPVTART